MSINTNNPEVDALIAELVAQVVFLAERCAVAAGANAVLRAKFQELEASTKNQVEELRAKLLP